MSTFTFVASVTDTSGVDVRGTDVDVDVVIDTKHGSLYLHPDVAAHLAERIAAVLTDRAVTL